jgi:hypothetical protein
MTSEFHHVTINLTQDRHQNFLPECECGWKGDMVKNSLELAESYARHVLAAYIQAQLASPSSSST